MKKISLLIIVSFFITTLFSQTTFQRTYGTSSEDVMLGLGEASDGGFVMMGRSNNNLYLVKTNVKGKKLWSKKYSIQGVFTGGIITLADGSIILSGNGDVQSATPSAFILKVDSTGTISWIKLYSTFNGFYIRNVKQTVDDGYIVVGDGFVIKLDSDGNVVWKRTVGAANSYRVTPYDVVQSQFDSSYVITSIFHNPTNTNNVGMISRFNKNGALLWSRSFSVINEDPLHLKENTYRKLQFVCGGGIMEFDKDGNNGKRITLNGSIKDWQLSKSADNGYICAGYNYSPNRKEDFYLTKLDSSYNCVWSKYVGGPKTDWAVSVVQSKNKEIIMGGNTKSFSIGGNDLYLVKVDSTGTLDCNDISFNGSATITNVPTQMQALLIDSAINVNIGIPGVTDYLVLNDSVNDACGCIPPTAEFTVGTSGNIDDKSLWAAKWYWDFGDGTIDSTQTEFGHTYPSNGTYTICLTVKNACGTDTACQTFDYVYTPLPVQNLTQDDFKVTIYPNPFTSQTNILFTEEQKNITIKIMDVVGKEIKVIDFTGKELLLEKGNMKQGVYFIRIIDTKGNVIAQKKMILLT
ncbi:MAG TPA: PKD domain-containing protein [Bacteroidia bacterium]|nr:PKD domain-containing protein [Bacteroidia bacterium]